MRLPSLLTRALQQVERAPSIIGGLAAFPREMMVKEQQQLVLCPAGAGVQVPTSL